MIVYCRPEWINYKVVCVFDAALHLIMTSAKKKTEKSNSELTTLQIFSKALTSGSEWCDKVNESTFITSHHIEETDAGLGRPLYLRNKLYDKTLKSEILLL